MKKKLGIVFIVLALIVGILVGKYSGKLFISERKPLYWIDSMEPSVHYPGPGKSAMGMELTPVYADEKNSSDQNAIRISSAVVNNLGVRIVPVSQSVLARKIETVGYIEPNENKITHIHTYADGWVKKLYVKTLGETVKANQLVMQFYSPTLVNVQEEYVIALSSNNQELIEASYQRLQSFHIAEQQIQQLKTTKKASELIDVYASQNGVVTELTIREGMRVTPEMDLMTIADLSNIWMIADVFEKQADWVKLGQSAEAKISAYPEKIWKGEVEYIYPQVDPTTRTLKIRFRFDNPDNILKPNMYANITLSTSPKENVLSVPTESLIRSSQGDHVIVALGNGRFQARSVTRGIESGDRVEILSGLSAGEKVVASGQFLIDSETNLKTSLERLDNPNPQAVPQIAGKGIIKAIDIKKHTIILEHEPIPALNWPVMTMDLPVDNAVDLTQFTIGDHVQFLLKKLTEDDFVITQLKKG